MHLLAGASEWQHHVDSSIAQHLFIVWFRLCLAVAQPRFPGAII